MTVPVHSADGALGLYGAVGDALAGRGLGFGRRRAALAGGFARHRGEDEDTVSASWCAGLLAEIGALAVIVSADAGEHRRSLAVADAPLYGARIAAEIPGLPPATADLIRWHREHADGTGFPDRLRWTGFRATRRRSGSSMRSWKRPTIRKSRVRPRDGASPSNSSARSATSSRVPAPTRRRSTNRRSPSPTTTRSSPNSRRGSTHAIRRPHDAANGSRRSPRR